MQKILKDYIINAYGIDNFQNIINENGLKYFYSENNHNMQFILNKANVILLQNELLRICKIFKEEKINYITFKGSILANKLYSNIYMRVFGDIDIYVFPKHFEKALNLLLNDGYSLKYIDGFFNPHHIALKKGKITVELHKHIFNPSININETYLLNNIADIEINKNTITTFTTTATILHLLYHLYMDTYYIFESFKNIIINKKINAKRFLYRAYEIVLFSEKYFKEIQWNEIIDDIKTQNLRIIFKKIILDILEIFPNAFPKTFTDTVLNLNYVPDSRDVICNYISKSSKSNPYGAISEYVDRNWYVHNNIFINIGESFELKKDNNLTNSEMNCKVDTQKIENGILLKFTVFDKDVYISEPDNYDTHTTSGIHLLLCGTENYFYDSVFIFPKTINNKNKTIACNVLNDSSVVLDKNLLKSEFKQIPNGYAVTVTLTTEFLNKNNIKKYFYLGLVIPYCNSKNKRRVDEIILSEINTEWYNPTYFAKINL